MGKGTLGGLILVLFLWGWAHAAAPETPPEPADHGSQAGEQQESGAPQVELPNTTGPIITDTALTQEYKTWAVQITPTLNLIGGVYNAHWQRRAAGSNQPTTVRDIPAPGNYKSFLVPTEIYYGLTPRMDVSVVVPFQQNWASNVGPSAGRPPSAAWGTRACSCATGCSTAAPPPPRSPAMSRSCSPPATPAPWSRNS